MTPEDLRRTDWDYGSAAITETLSSDTVFVALLLVCVPSYFSYVVKLNNYLNVGVLVLFIPLHLHWPLAGFSHSVV